MPFTQNAQNNTAPETKNTPSADSRSTEVNLFAVGVRAAFCTVIAIVLLFGCFLSVFSYSAMRFYDKIGNKEMALSSAEKYLKRNSDKTDSPSSFGKYADSLYYAANTSAYFFNRLNDKYGTQGGDVIYFAEKLNKYSGEYLGYASLNERTSKIDEYNITHALAAARPQVFSYRNYLSAMRFKSQYVMYRNALNKGDNARAQLYKLDMLNSVQETISGWGESDSQFAITDNNANQAFLMFSQLTAYINGELHELGLKSALSSAPNGVLFLKSNEDNGIIGNTLNSFELFIQTGGFDRDEENPPFTKEYNDITRRYAAFVEYLRQNCVKYTVGSAEQNAPTQQLKFASYLKALSDFTVAMQNMTSVLSANTNHYDSAYETALKQSNETWLNNLFVTNVRIYTSAEGGTLKPEITSGYIYEWYERGMLQDYLAYLQR